MSAGVFTNQYRVNFVKGYLDGVSDPDAGGIPCGVNTFHNVEVTLEQLEELLYRVKDAWFTAGSFLARVTDTIDEDEFDAVSIAIATGTPSPDYASYEEHSNDTVTFVFRGYHEYSNDIETNHLPFSDYFGESYDVGEYGVDWFGDTYRDVKDNERIMFSDVFNRDLAKGQTNTVTGISHQIYYVGGSIGAGLPDVGYGLLSSGKSNGDEITAAGLFLSLWEDPWYGFDGTNGLARVAVIGNFENPASQGNRFFISLIFSTAHDYDGDGSSFIPPILSSNTVPSYYNLSASPVCNLVIRLASGDVTCPLYAKMDPTMSESGDVYYSFSGTDFVLQAQEWWPYAKDSPPTPVWDSTTGVKF